MPLFLKLSPKAKPTSLSRRSFGLHSIGTKLFVAIMGSASLGLGTLGYRFYEEIKSDGLNEIKHYTDAEVRALDAQLRRSETYLKGVVAATSALHERGIRAPEAYKELVQSFMPSRPNIISGFGIMQTPFSLVDRQWYGPYVEESLMGRGVKLADNPKFSYVDLWAVDQYNTLQYYQDTVRSPNYNWSEPYLNEVFPISLITFAGPIRDRKGSLIGVINGDISLQDLQKLVSTKVFRGKGYFLIATHNGTLLAPPFGHRPKGSFEKISTFAELNPVWQKIQQKKAKGETSGILFFNNNHWLYRTVPSTGWIFMSTVPNSAIVEPALQASAVATLLAAVFVAGVIWLFIKFLNYRLQPILDVCNEVEVPAEHAIEALQAKDELDLLAKSFFSLMKQKDLLMERLQQTNTELIAANRLKDEFLANMSHELRTPINAILGMTECLQEDVFGIINKRQLNALQTIEDSASHLLSLINDILDVAKIESGQVKLDYSQISIEDLCVSSLAFIQQQALKKGIVLNTNIPSPLPDLYVDTIRMKQVLLNLLTNAVKFTPEGGTITLTASLLPPEQNALQAKALRIAITDTGIGIAPENIPKLFKPFVQIDGALNRQYTGTGLGLALVKQIVKLHGGQVGLTSELGVGSCFMVDLPSEPQIPPTVTEKSAPCAHEAHHSTPQTSAASPPEPPLILLAEDNPANVETIANYLEAKGYRFLFANNGQEAINLALSHHPNAILMDVQMPVMDGLEATKQIRQQESLRDTPIIALTALAMKGDQERCFAAGVDRYLTKPVRLKQLDSFIQELLTDRYPK